MTCNWPRARVLSLIVICSAILSGCTTMTATNAPVTRDLPRMQCLIFTPLSWHDDDTRGTIIGVKRHNAVYARQCSSIIPIAKPEIA